MNKYISGRSSLIELIAINAAISEEKRAQKLLLRAFNSILQSMSRFSELDIIFDMFYAPNTIDSDIKNQRPLVLDPSNPYKSFCCRIERNIMTELRNEMWGWTRSMMTYHLDILWTDFRQIKRQLFEEFAKVSLNRVEEYYQKTPIDLAFLSHSRKKYIKNSDIISQNLITGVLEFVNEITKIIQKLFTEVNIKRSTKSVKS